MPTITFIIAFLAAHRIATNAEQLDVTIIADGSSTICDSQPCKNWNYILQFICDIVGNLTVGPDNSLVSLVLLGDQPELLWNFNKYTDSASLLGAIENVAFPGGELAAAIPLEFFVNKVFSSTAGYRLGALKVIIGITDGAPRIDANQQYAESTAVQNIGAKVFIVCVTDRCPEGFAQGLSSPPKKIDETYFLVEDYSSLCSALKKLLKQMSPMLSNQATNVLEQ